MAYYLSFQNYYTEIRNLLQDTVGPPYRYPDYEIVNTFNIAMWEISKRRPDIFLDVKYQQPQPKVSAITDGVPGLYTVNPPGPTGVAVLTPTVPVAQIYFLPIVWFCVGYLQFYDVDDTQDARAQAFIQKFIGDLGTMAA